MKLKDLSKEPQLIKILITKEDLVEKYGDELEFFVYDRQSLDTFTKLANAKEGELGQMTDLLKQMILDEEGNPVMTDKEVLPMDVMMESLRLVSEELGKSLTTQ
jgi:hypothetical protein